MSLCLLFPINTDTGRLYGWGTSGYLGKEAGEEAQHDEDEAAKPRRVNRLMPTRVDDMRYRCSDVSAADNQMLAVCGE